MYELDPLPVGIRTLTDDELHHLKGEMTPPKGPERCVTCLGRKTFRWWNPERTEAVDWRCNCIDQFILHLAMLNANIGLAYQRLAWADATAVPDEGLEKSRYYLDNADRFMQSGIGLIFYGTNGTGKSLLATLLAKGLLGLGYNVYFTTFTTMIETFTSGWYDTEQRQWFHRRIKNADLLVLDDVGKEYQGKKQSGLPESTFDEVLRHRVASALPTIVTTNYDLPKLSSGYGHSVMSLLRECSTACRMDGLDFRPEARTDRVDRYIAMGMTQPVTIG